MDLVTKPPASASAIDLSSIARYSAFRLAFIISLYSASESITIFSFLGLDIINVSPLKTLSHKLLKLSLTSMLFTAIEVVEAIRHSNYRINGSIIFDLALVVADIIVIVLLSIVINKSIVRPAKRAKNDLDDIILGIESGQGNLTLRVFDETSDEIGQLANGVNHFIETLQNLMVKIQSVSKDMKKSSYLIQNEAESSNMSASNVSATSEELAASMEEVSASLYDLAQGCNNLLEKMEGMNEDAKNSAMKLREVKLTAENSYKEAIASKEKQ